MTADLASLWRLAETAGDLTVTYMDSEWMILHQYGLVRDCSLDSALDASQRLVPGFAEG